VNCEACGTELPFGAMFCGECGRAVGVKSVQRHPDSGMPVVAGAMGVEPSEVPPAPLEEAALSEAAASRPGDTVIIDSFDLESLATARASAPEPEPVPSEGIEQDLPADIDVPADFDEPVDFEKPVDFDKPVDFEKPAEFERPVLSETPVVPVQRFDPFPWGERPAASPVPDAEAGDDDFEQTLIVPRRDSGERFVLQFSTGESVTVSGSGLVGRNPMPQPGEFFDYLVSISDPGKSVSKTHLEFGQDAGAFWVSDRFSGNGSVVREPGMPPKRLGAGKRFRIVRGSRVDIGEQFFVVS
jgi:hypothetical protein